jgi:hypothetical protein
MVVLLIVSALAVLVLPSLTPLLGGQDFRTAAGRLGEAFARARLDAVIDGTRRRVVIDLDAGRFWVDRIPRITSGSGAVDMLNSWEQDPSLPEPVRRELPSGLRLVEAVVWGGDPVTSGRVVVRVLPLGLSEPCLLVLADANNSEKSLDIASTGEPVWRDAATTTTIDRRTP